MFNRLPIYTRPKEPAIGYPTLTESTNTHLTGQILGLDGRPIPLPSIGGYPYTIGYKIASFKGLPDIPSVGTSLRDDSYSEDSEEESLRPPAPLKIKNLDLSTCTASSSALLTHSHKTTESMSSSASSPRQPPPKQQRKGIHRKPAPATNPNFSLSAKSSAEMIRGKSTTPEGSSRRAFGLGSVVKEKVSGRRRPVETPSYSSDRHSSDIFDPLEAPSPIALAKPPNFVSIDDWLDTREREGLHRRSNTITTVNTVATRYNDPIRLHIRQSAFEPLPKPHELAPPESIPSMPQIPSQYRSAVSKVSAPSVPPSPPVIELTTTPPVPKEEEEKPRDHIEQLEWEQDKLAAKRSDVKREIWDIKQLLPPNPSTHNRVAREDMNKRLAELMQELAEVEKEVHENGMKLHRAWRRRDKKMGIEGPTHLWVSRVRE